MERTETTNLPLDRPAILEADYDIHLNEAGPLGIMRLHAILDCLQDIAARHADLLGVGLPDLKSMGILWILSRIKLRMNFQPVIGERLRITTWPGPLERLFCTRQYEIRSLASGKLLGAASSFWLMLNDKTLRPIAPAPLVHGKFPDNSARPFYFPETGKLPECTGAAPVVWHVGQSMIDYNNHLNNAYYAAFAQDWLAAFFKRLVLVNEIQINFNFSLKLEESLSVAGEAEDGEFRLEGRTESGKNVFQAVGRYTEYPK